MMNEVIDKFAMKEKVKHGHNSLIVENVVPKEIVEVYEGLQWHVLTTDEALILGDSGVVIETNLKQRRFKPVEFLAENIVNCFFPISSNKLIVGTIYKGTPSVNVRTINSAMAKCAYDMFVCNDDNLEARKLSKTIGAWAGLVLATEWRDETNDMFDNIISDLLSGKLLLNDS